MPKIAISYRRTDSAQIAGRIRERLAAQYGKDSIFIDIYDIPLGSEFPRHVQQVWSETDVLLALIGPNWVRGEAQLWPAVALAYLGLPAFVLLVAHYVIVNALDLDTLYLRMAAFFIALLFGAGFYWKTRTNPIAGFAVGGMLGVIAVTAMTVSTSLRYHQPIMPSGNWSGWRTSNTSSRSRSASVLETCRRGCRASRPCFTSERTGYGSKSRLRFSEIFPSFRYCWMGP